MEAPNLKHSCISRLNVPAKPLCFFSTTTAPYFLATSDVLSVDPSLTIRILYLYEVSSMICFISSKTRGKVLSSLKAGMVMTTNFFSAMTTPPFYFLSPKRSDNWQYGERLILAVRSREHRVPLSRKTRKLQFLPATALSSE